MNFITSSWFVDLLLFTVYALLVATLALTLWSMWHSYRKRQRQSSDNGVPTRGIAWGVWVLLAVTLAATWLFASTRPLSINGSIYDNRFWLRASDMLINSSLVLISVAVMGVLFGMSGLSRRLKGAHRNSGKERKKVKQDDV